MLRFLTLAATLALVPMLAPRAALAVTPDEIRACEADRAGPGCATLRTRLFVCQAASAMAGCAELIALRDAALAAPEPEPEPTPEPAPVAEAEAACPVIAAADWRARVGPVEGVAGLRLIVEGRVTLPTPGWTVALTAGMADRSAMPVQRIVLSAAPPQMAVAQVLTDYELRLEIPALAPAYRGVIVDCAGLALVEIEVAP
jgi:hypothetical protein